MVSVRFGRRALCEKNPRPLGFEDQKLLLDKVSSYLPSNVCVVLMGDRFFWTVDLVEYCKLKNWDYRLRLKNNLIVIHV